MAEIPVDIQLFSFLVSSLPQSIVQRYVSGRKRTTHKGWQSLPSTLKYSLAWCCHDSKSTFQRYPSGQTPPHTEGWRTCPAKLNTLLLGVVAIPYEPRSEEPLANHNPPSCQLAHTHNKVAIHECRLCVEPRTCELAPVQVLNDSEGIQNALCASSQ